MNNCDRKKYSEDDGKRNADEFQQGFDASLWYPVFHVPHDGNEFPEELLQSICIPMENFKACHEKMRDKDVSILIPPSYQRNNRVYAFSVSRLLCDVERFIGPEEVMEQYGMGFCYEKAFDGTVIKRVTEELRRKTRKYYEDHHSRINRLCEQHRRILFIDMHSYSKEIIPADFLRAEQTLPDLCIGVDKSITPPRLVRAAVHSFQEAGLSVAINYPYSGCYVPESIMNGKAACDFAGIMLEFQRNAYMNEKNERIRENVERIRNAIQNILHTVIGDGSLCTAKPLKR
jgi:N-formylglutamate amidohydrolase